MHSIRNYRLKVWNGNFRYSFLYLQNENTYSAYKDMEINDLTLQTSLYNEQ